jgi:hypothetical protein
MEFRIDVRRTIAIVRAVSTFEQEFNAAVQSAERGVLLDLIRSRPDMSLADLVKLTKGRFAGLLSSVSIGDLLRGGGGVAVRSSSAAVRAGAVDTRTPSARKRYDDAVLRVVKASSQPMSAQEVRVKVGGTPLQARKALNRLIEQGRLGFEGKARATRYFAG